MRKPLVVVVGPTASGKSDLGMAIAERFNGEIICADSRTVYRGMDIGTAKPSISDMERVKHHLVDVVDPTTRFSAAEFKTMATEAIVDITTRGKLPVMVGGTGLYVDSVVFNYAFGAKADEDTRRRLSSMSVEELQNMCRENNIVVRGSDKNKRHLIRSIETEGQDYGRGDIRADTIMVGLKIDRDALRQRIERRAEWMVKQGVLDEVRVLADEYGWGSEAMTGGIYKCLRPVIEDGADLDEAVREFVRSDMRLAKRQMTWFKRNKYINWSESSEFLIKKVDQFLRQG